MKRSFEEMAVVTGAGGTLCSEIAVSLAAKGAGVVLIGRSEAKLTPVAEKIRQQGGTCMICVADVLDEAALERVAAEAEKQYGPCRYLINGAGGNQMNAMTTSVAFEPAELSGATRESERGFFELDMNVFGNVLAVNTVGTVNACRVFGRRMAAAGGGAILNFASMNSFCPLSRVPAYAMSKAAIVNFTQFLAAYLAPAGIRVNAVAPGFFVNERSVRFLRTADGGLSARGECVMAHTPMKRFGEASDLIGCVEWLLDNERAAFVTGVTIPVDGGFLSTTGV